MGSFKTWLEAGPAAPPALAVPKALDQGTMNKVTTYLGQLQQAGFVLVVHQTDHDTALKITQGQSFGRGRGVLATALYSTPQSVRAVIEKMHATGAGQDASRMPGNIHRSSTGIVVMAIPKVAAGRGPRDLDDTLADAMQNGLIPDLSVPNQYIVGFWRADGQFFGNSRFNPKNGPLG